MKRIIKFLRLLILVGLIFLASVGVGLSGAAPPSLFRDTIKSEKEQNTEQVENKDDREKN